MMNKTYVVTGATGAVGKAVIERLKAHGAQVRLVSRRSGMSFDDVEALKQAFSGADGAYLMIPFDMQVPDLHKREDEIGMKLAEAVKGAGVQRVVLLSGLNAHLRGQIDLGSSLGAAMMEERLDSLGIAELVHLRAPFFMENHFNLGLIEHMKMHTRVCLAWVSRPALSMLSSRQPAASTQVPSGPGSSDQHRIPQRRHWSALLKMSSARRTRQRRTGH
jgi:uncharacterized protein YbjT (DUF2867 family)